MLPEAAHRNRPSKWDFLVGLQTHFFKHTFNYLVGGGPLVTVVFSGLMITYIITSCGRRWASMHVEGTVLRSMPVVLSQSGDNGDYKDCVH